MIAEAIDKILKIAHPNIYHEGDKLYADREMVLLNDGKKHFSSVRMNGLPGLVTLIQKEAVKIAPVFVMVEGPTRVSAFTAADEDWQREPLYTVEAETTGFDRGYRTYEKFVIELRSRFVPNEGSQYLLDLLSRMDITERSTSEDNGVTQSVTVRQGVALKDAEMVKPIVSLIPYRTFFDVNQPESDFLVRVDRDGSIGLFEADGGMWQHAAKIFITEWLEVALAEEIKNGQVSILW